MLRLRTGLEPQWRRPAPLVWTGLLTVANWGLDSGQLPRLLLMACSNVQISYIPILGMKRGL